MSTPINADLIRMTTDAARAITTEADADTVCRAITFRDALKDATRALCDQIEESVIEWIRVNGEVSIGDVRYYVAPNKDTKCKSVLGTLRAALEATGGDVDSIAQLLSASAWKPGACKKVLGEDVCRALFETRETDALKTGEPPRDRLQASDGRFAP